MMIEKYQELKNKSTVHPGVSHVPYFRDARGITYNADSHYARNINSNLKILRNIHRGQTAILFGRGPSINDYKEIDDGSFIRVGMNAGMLPPPFHLFFVVDLEGDEFELMKDYQPEYAKFYSMHQDGLYYDYVHAGAIPFQLKVSPWRDINLKDDAGKTWTWYLEDVDIIHEHKFTRNIYKEYPLLNGSVCFISMQFLLYMGFEKIYLAGCDASGGHYDDLNYRMVSPGLGHNEATQLPQRWYFFKQWVEKVYPRVKLISVNPVSLKGVMDEDIYT